MSTTSTKLAAGVRRVKAKQTATVVPTKQPAADDKIAVTQVSPNKVPVNKVNAEKVPVKKATNASLAFSLQVWPD